MNIVFVAVVWFVLGLVVCFLSGRGIADAQAPSNAAPNRETPASRRPAEPRRFTTTLAVHEWALVAERTATAELLAARPGVPSGKV